MRLVVMPLRSAKHSTLFKSEIGEQGGLSNDNDDYIKNTTNSSHCNFVPNADIPGVCHGSILSSLITPYTMLSSSLWNHSAFSASGFFHGSFIEIWMDYGGFNVHF
jgi:hypothetical protein